VPRLGKVAQRQADARSLMTGRITDAYTNIATVKLFSHTHREAALPARHGEFMHRLRADAPGEPVRIVNHVLNVGC
jgi:ATP-binding cassette subfamily B multidrug efflux pump